MVQKRVGLIWLLLFLVSVLTLTGCKESETQVSAGTEEKKVVAFARFAQETNIFSPVPTTLRDFEAPGLLYGDEILENTPAGELTGFLKAIEEFGDGVVEAIPVLRAESTSGGSIEFEVYQRFKNELITGLSKIKELDGVYLSLHGSMGVEGMVDPEGDLLRGIRDVLGEELPIGVSYDLHANITEANARLATFIVGYKTNPHRDQYQAGYSAGKILAQTVRGQVKPVLVYKKMKLLKGGGMNIDLLAPMRKIFSRMKKMERQEDVLSVSNFMVHIWLDEPELGWSTVAVTDDNPPLAEELATEIADLNWAVRDYPHAKVYSPEEAVKLARDKWLARKLGAVFLCDSADAVAAGAPGENTWILKALLENAPELISYVPLRDAGAVRQAYRAEIGETVTLTVGGKLEQVYNRSVDYEGEVIRKLEGRYGKTVVVKSNGIHLILSELPAPAKKPEFFKELDLSIWQADVVVVKNLFPFRIWFTLYNRKTINVETPGTTSVDVYNLHYENIPRPIYPFDELTDWR